LKNHLAAPAVRRASPGLTKVATMMMISKTTMKMTWKTLTKKIPSFDTSAVDPPRNCALCPRLAAYRQDNIAKYPGWYNGAAPSFGPPDARLLIIGLAPGLKGANRTSRAFGDFSGDLLFAVLDKFGFSAGKYAASPDDGLMLKGAMITNAVRCAPPKNKPAGAEIRQCRPYLLNQINALASLKVLLCLGRIAHDSTIAALGLKRKEAPFRHGARHAVQARKIAIFDSYHCSRYNINTRRLTAAMFESVFEDVRSELADLA